MDYRSEIPSHRDIVTSSDKAHFDLCRVDLVFRMSRASLLARLPLYCSAECATPTNSSLFANFSRNFANAPLPPDHSALALFAQRTRIPTSARSIGFCAIWVCISSSSSSFGQIGHRKGPVQLALTEISPRCLARRSQTAPVP